MLTALICLGIGFLLGAGVFYYLANKEPDLVYIHRVKGLKCCTHEGIGYQLKRVPESGMLDTNIDQ